MDSANLRRKLFPATSELASGAMPDSYFSPDSHLARSHLFRFAAEAANRNRCERAKKVEVKAEVAVRHYPTDTRSVEISDVSITI